MNVGSYINKLVSVTQEIRFTRFKLLCESPQKVTDGERIKLAWTYTNEMNLLNERINFLKDNLNQECICYLATSADKILAERNIDGMFIGAPIEDQSRWNKDNFIPRQFIQDLINLNSSSK